MIVFKYVFVCARKNQYTRLTLSYRYFAAGSLFLWYVDKLSRGVRAALLCAPAEVEWVPRNSMVRLKLGRDSYKFYEPGQYFFVNIPQLSINEW